MILPIYFNSVELKTLGDFLTNEGMSPAFTYRTMPEQFLLLQDESGKSNYQKIIDATIEKEDKERQEALFASGQFNSLKLFPPVVFSIDTKLAKSDLFNTQGNLVQNTDSVNYFISQKLANLMLNPGYVLKGNNSSGGVKSTHPKLTVWLWSRSLSFSLGTVASGRESNYELINLSPFIDDINMSSTKEGSSFSISLAPIKGSLGVFPEGWKIKKDSISFSDSKTNPEYRAISHIDDKNLQNKDFFFHNIIQQNDLIFISFEDLKMEKGRYRSDLSVPFKAINEKIWDLIGLVDSNEIGISKEGQASVSINVAGRDLTKLIIEDGSYFWATEFGLDGTIQFAGNKENRISKRIGASGFNSYFSRANKSIEGALRFVISQLANTGLVPNEVFQNYGNRRSTLFTNETIGREAVLSGGGDRSLDEIPKFNIQEKTFKQLKEVIADGVWGITKIIIDPQIANLRLVDSALFVEQGSFINYINRICQEEFVQFYTETIGDEFYWIARKPPYNQKSILDSIKGSYTSEGSISKSPDGFYMMPEVVLTSSLVIDVEPIDVVRVNLRFDERAYSWFKFEPRYALGGGKNKVVNLALFPAVFLPTYTNLFGSRPMNVSSNYVNYIPSTGKEDNDNYKNAIEQAYYDLAWLIETNSYLPFTRTGSITINEDRRIKKGIHIRLQSTGEIFLVTSVSHNMSMSKSQISRQTIVQVERGMVEEFIEGKVVSGFGKVSYFNIVDTPISLERLRSQEVGNQYQPIANWRENERVINFFIQRRQFGKND